MGKIMQLLAHAELSRAKREVAKAKKAPAREADGLFNDAYKKFAVAMEFDVNNAVIPHQWGLALLDHARVKEGAEASKLFKSACEQLQTALKLDPANAEILNDWGATLMEQAGQKRSSKVAAPLYKKAKDKFAEAEKYQPGLAAYNLACLHSLQGEREECAKYLEQARESGRLPSVKYLNTDEDLKRFRQEPWFQAFLQSVSKQA